MKTGRGWWALAVWVGVLTLLGLYVGAYYATVVPEVVELVPGRFGPGKYVRVVVEDYQWIDYDRGRCIFWPIHQIDRYVIRRALWKEIR